MARLVSRLTHVEGRLAAPPRCPDPCHRPPADSGMEVHVIDYRAVVAILSADPAEAARAHQAQLCATCGLPASGVEIRAVDYGPAASPGVGGRLSLTAAGLDATDSAAATS